MDTEKKLRQLEQALDMQMLVSQQYREVFYDCLNMSNRNGKLSPNDARILLSQVLISLQQRQKGLNETSPETYKKLKKEIESLRKDREKLVKALRFYAGLDSWQEEDGGVYDGKTAVVSADYESLNYVSDDDERPSTDLFGGKLARTTLKELGELE